MGPLRVPRGAIAGVPVVEIARTNAGTLAMRGPMVPRRGLSPDAEQNGQNRLGLGADGFLDTGYPCRIDPATQAVVVTAPPSGIVSVGGYRLALNAAQDRIRGVDGNGTIVALPDLLLGHRLAASIGAPGAARAALMAVGANPLIVEACRDRRGESANAA
jgi:hypothetical protein